MRGRIDRNGKGASAMLLAIDIGNSNISVGLFDQKRDLKFLSSIDTDSRKTADQISIDLMNIFSLYQYDLRDVSGAIFSSVVPPINFMMAKALTRLLGKPPMIVGPGVKTGLNIRMEIHNQLGADLVAGAVAALDKYPTPIIMIDMGTATTFCVVDTKGNYLGGAVAPGIGISMEALFQRASKLPRIELVKTPKIICRNTVSAMQAGIYYGFVGQIDEIVNRIKEELNEPNVKVIATGGLATLIAKSSKTIDVVDPMLTLKGLLVLYEKNRNDRR